MSEESLGVVRDKPVWRAGGLEFDSPVMIGAGVCKTLESALAWMESAAGGVETGSYTPLERGGNEGTVFYPTRNEDFLRAGFGLNSFGMPNVGFKRIREELEKTETEKPLIVSIAGFSIEDYLKGLKMLYPCYYVAAITLNFGCPNTGHSGRIMSFDLRGIETMLNQLKQFDSNYQTPIWMKVSPYTDPMQLKEVAAIVNSSRRIKAIVTCNTFPNAYAGRESISPNDGLAGLSGPALKHIAMGQVWQWRKHLNSDIDVIGVGGITTGNDVVDFLDAGANAVQVVSLPFWLGEPRRLGEALMAEGTSERFQTLFERE